MKRSICIPLFIILLLAACQTKTTAVPENFQEISQPMAENLFTSLKNNDFSSFHKDFTEKMLSSISEDQFVSLHDSISQTVGEYQALTYDQSTYEEGYLISYFSVQFSDGSLTLRLVLDSKEPYRISGFWFPDFPSQ